MGVNLRELGLFLIIMIAIWAGLVVYFLSTQAKRTAQAFMDRLNNAYMQTIAKSDSF